jgi:4'-phosphopantetheinyl transferase
MWTRKEAFLKAIGKGLHVPLDAFDVLSLSEKPVDVSNEDIKIHSDKTLIWHVKDLKPHSAFAAAYAVEGQASHRWFHWPV